MMKKNKKILIIQNADPLSFVRTGRFYNFFKYHKYDTRFLGWERLKRISKDIYKDTSIQYLMKDSSRSFLFIYYIKWSFLLFFYLLKNRKKYDYFLVINFETAISAYLASKFCKIDFIYDIWDDFDLRYKLPTFLKKIIYTIDSKIKRAALTTIHVDTSRVRKNDTKYIVIENSPIDIFTKPFTLPKRKEYFVVSGLLTKERGDNEIISFIKSNPSIKFHFYISNTALLNKKLLQTIQSLKNIQLFGYLPQSEFLKKIKDCSGIFCLHNPSLDIFKANSPNKLFDGMMLGIPIIVNKNNPIGDFVEKHKIGVTVNYTHDASWDIITSVTFKKNIDTYGNNGRKLYEKKYNFLKNAEKILPFIQ